MSRTSGTSKSHATSMHPPAPICNRFVASKVAVKLGWVMENPSEGNISTIMHSVDIYLDRDHFSKCISSMLG
jgi:hypothetical protein